MRLTWNKVAIGDIACRKVIGSDDSVLACFHHTVVGLVIPPILPKHKHRANIEIWDIGVNPSYQKVEIPQQLNPSGCTREQLTEQLKCLIASMDLQLNSSRYRLR